MLTWTHFQSSTAWPQWWAFPPALHSVTWLVWPCGPAGPEMCANPVYMCLLQTCLAAWAPRAPPGSLLPNADLELFPQQYSLALCRALPQRNA